MGSATRVCAAGFSKLCRARTLSRPVRHSVTTLASPQLLRPSRFMRILRVSSQVPIISCLNATSPFPSRLSSWMPSHAFSADDDGT
ncbi:hypothetical protein KP509_26G040500 [Ceratopteris richardii]|uniref:Uncharacterized protein n=1 Tax=Ceratopteris richardii TaxID=49495 RepID=A0A8T2RMK4_CERRI|nr:hypothetical protein KP509_26G040500 [Ceratopteris richardii]